MNRKNQCDAHIHEWRTSPYGKCLRRFNSERLHDQHVKLFNGKLKQSLSNNTRWTRDADGKEQCLVWTGAVSKDRQAPAINMRHGSEYNAITQYQRIYCGVHLPNKHVWSRTNCGNESCLRHRFPQSKSEFQRKEMETRSVDPAWVLACTVASRSRSKFTQHDVARMHALRSEGLSNRQIADSMGVKLAGVTNILCGKRWAGVKHAPSGISFITSQLLGARA